jgi:ATP-dependent Clp protease adaptor protein ClpS
MRARNNQIPISCDGHGEGGHDCLRCRQNSRAPTDPLMGVENRGRDAKLFTMPEGGEPLVLPDTEQEQQTVTRTEKEPGYLVICWDDPVNFMDYVTHVFQTVFGWTKQKAEVHMLQVHNQGKSVLTRESLERAEHYVHQLHKYHLHATMEAD